MWSEHWDTSLWVEGSKMVLFEEQIPVLFVDDRAVMDMVWIETVRKRSWRKDAMGLWIVRLVDIRQNRIYHIPSPTNSPLKTNRRQFSPRAASQEESSMHLSFNCQVGKYLNWLNRTQLRTTTSRYSNLELVLGAGVNPKSVRYRIAAQ